MKELNLSNTTLVALVDDEDFERLYRRKWIWIKAKNGKGCIGCFGVYYTSLAQAVMQDRSTSFDHIDRNPLNNSKQNLRPATQSQNLINRPKKAGTSSKYRGVSWERVISKWSAKIKLNGKSHHLGSFDFELNAALAYDQAAKLLHKTFAICNFNIT